MCKTKKRPRVICAMSGGVDSSVAAALLCQKGYEVIGVFMHFWAEKSNLENSYHKLANKCCSLEAQEQARRCAKILGIPFYTLNFEKEFKKYVVDYFIKSYQCGLTPNPCVMCNKWVKFNFLFKKALALGADFLATGHYVRKVEKQKSPSSSRSLLKTRNSNQNPKSIQYKLQQAKDRLKDQSYFLYNLTQEQLKHLLFPMGDYTKKKTRRLAKKFGLPTAFRRESQEVCFVLEKDYSKFLRKYLKNIKPGPIIDTKGRELGKHRGLPFYTKGQRKGIRIGGIGPFYVVDMNRKKNTLIVTGDPQDRKLYSKSLITTDTNWISGRKPKNSFFCEVKVRYRQPSVKAKILRSEQDYYKVIFARPQRAVMPGQSCVFYQGEEVLGGGIIETI